MRKVIASALAAIRPFVPVSQMKCLEDGIRWSEERAHFREKVLRLADTVASMPVTYAQSELGEDAVVHLHYFYGGCDWWITEKDVDGGVDQAFGLVDLGHGPELGYISIRELVRMRGLEVDLYWQPITLKALRAKRLLRIGAEAKPKEYSIVSKRAGQKPVVLAEVRRLSLVEDEPTQTKPANGVYH